MSGRSAGPPGADPLALRDRPVLDYPSACALAERWTLDISLALLVRELQRWINADSYFVGGRPPSNPLQLRILSGYRTPERQAELEREGRPTAHPSLSNHTICPARAVDFETLEIRDDEWLEIARLALFIGLRWAGQHDRNHFDLGPRDDAVAREYRRTL